MDILDFKQYQSGDMLEEYVVYMDQSDSIIVMGENVVMDAVAPVNVNGVTLESKRYSFNNGKPLQIDIGATGSVLFRRLPPKDLQLERPVEVEEIIQPEEEQERYMYNMFKRFMTNLDVPYDVAKMEQFENDINYDEDDYDMVAMIDEEGVIENNQRDDENVAVAAEGNQSPGIDLHKGKDIEKNRGDEVVAAVDGEEKPPAAESA